MDKQYERTRRTRRRPQKRKCISIYSKRHLKNIKLENARPWSNTWFLVQEIHLYLRQTSTRNEQMLTRMDDQRKDHIDPKGPKQRNRSKRLQTHNLLTDDVENINSTNKEKNLLLANKPRIVPRGEERIPQRIQKHNRVTLHRSARPNWVQNQSEKSSLAWIDYKKSYDMVPKSWIINCLKNIKYQM